MLVRCPKCGFSQPEDQYCAQCGIDMVAYQPPKQSTFLQLLRDPLFHLSFVIFISILGAILLIRKNKAPEVASMAVERRLTVPLASPNTPTAPSSTAPAPSSEAPKTATTEMASQSHLRDLKLEATETTTTANRIPLPGATVALTKSKEAPTTGTTWKVKVVYAEVNWRVLDSFVEESAKAGQYNSFADFSAGLLPQFQRKIAGLTRGFKTLRTDTDSIEVGKTLNWSFNYSKPNSREPAAGAPATATPSNDLAYSTQVNLEDVENQIFKGNIEIIKSVKETQDPNLTNIQKINYPAAFEISSDMAFFMAGLGSHRADAPRPENEFVVFLQFEK